MPVVLLFIGLFVLFSLGIYLLIRKSGDLLTLRQVVLFYGAKIAMGCLYGYIFKRFYNGDDTWILNNDSRQQYKRLTEETPLFFKELFVYPSPASAYPAFFNGSSYWQQLEFLVTTKLMAPFNAVSGGNYYINILFFNFLTFWGGYFLYKLFSAQFGKNNLAMAAIFFFPPTLFWLSGYRSEGFLFLFTGFLLYYFGNALQKRTWKHTLAITISIFFLFIFRIGFAILLIPGLLVWAISVKTKINPIKVAGYVYGALLLLIFVSSILSKEKNFFSFVANRQHEFLALKGTRFNLSPLENSFTSFVKVFPQAVLNVSIRPYLWEAKGALQWMVAIENLFVFVIVLFSLLRKPSRLFIAVRHPLIMCLLLILACNYLIIGYTVPFPGAIVRYKIIPELLLLIMAAHNIKLENNLIRLLIGKKTN